MGDGRRGHGEVDEKIRISPFCTHRSVSGISTVLVCGTASKTHVRTVCSANRTLIAPNCHIVRQIVKHIFSLLCSYFPYSFFFIPTMFLTSVIHDCYKYFFSTSLTSEVFWTNLIVFLLSV